MHFMYICTDNIYIYTIYIRIRYWVGGSVRPLVCLSVHDRNHLPVVQFQIQAHIRNPHDPAEAVRPFGAPQAP